jgi:hypothetical protein
MSAHTNARPGQDRRYAHTRTIRAFRVDFTRQPTHTELVLVDESADDAPALPSCRTADGDERLLDEDHIS